MALTKVPAELSSTPGIVDNSNDTAITIDSSENVLVGTTDAAPGVGNTDTGGAFGSNGYGVFSRTGTAAQATAYFNKNTNDGTIIALNKDGTAVGGISVASGNNLTIDGLVASHAGLEFGTGRITPRVAGATSDGVVDLGYSTQRFQDLFLSGDIAHLDAADNARLLYDKSSNLLGNAGTNLYGAGIYLGGTAAANLLDDYEEGTWTPSWTGLGNGSASGTYTKIGRLVHVTALFTAGSTTSIGSKLEASNLPFAAQFLTYSGARYENYQSNSYIGATRVTGSQIRGYIINVAGATSTESIVSATNPFTWGVNDYAQLTATYYVA